VKVGDLVKYGGEGAPLAIVVKLTTQGLVHALYTSGALRVYKKSQLKVVNESR